MFSSLMRNRVVLKTFTAGPGQPGSGTRTPSAGTTFTASVQLGESSRDVGQGRTGATAGGKVFFTSRPVDTSAGARTASPEVIVQDLLIWQVAPGAPSRDRVLVAQGPATPEGGRSVVWSVSVIERK
jgi:hypothetical protein